MQEVNPLLIVMFTNMKFCSSCGGAGPFMQTSSEYWCLNCQKGWGYTMTEIMRFDMIRSLEKPRRVING